MCGGTRSLLWRGWGSQSHHVTNIFFPAKGRILFRLASYVPPQIRKITNLFRLTKVKIAFKYNNKISQLMKPNTDNNTPCYNRSGIYILTCNTCKLACVGQTRRSLKLRFQEHITIHQEQKRTISIYPTYPTQPTWIQTHRPLNDHTQASQWHDHANPLWTIIHSNPPPRKATNSWAIPRPKKKTRL